MVPEVGALSVMLELFNIYLLVGLAVAFGALLIDEDSMSGEFFICVFFFWPALILLGFALVLWAKIKSLK